MKRDANIVLFPIRGDLDVRSAPRVRASLDGLIASGCRRIILNLTDTSYVDSAGMALILTEVRKMRAAGGLLSLTNVPARVLHMLKVSRLVDFIPVSGSLSKPQVRELDPSVRPLWRIAVPVDENDLASLRCRLEQLLGRTTLSADDVFDMTLAVGEAVGNAVDHTDGSGVLVTVTSYPDRVVVEVTDRGDGYSLAADEEPTSSGGEERGRGIKLMRLLADSVSISMRPSGLGTVVKLVKLMPGTDV